MRALLATLFLLAPLTTLVVLADDPPPADPAPIRPDSAFDKYFESDTLTRGWDDTDPAALADALLQLAEGERVLLREHRGGLSVKKLFPMVLKVAADRRDKATLDRLATATAKNPALAEFAAAVKAAQALSAAPRSTGPALTIPGGEIDPATVAAFADLNRDIRHATLLADKEALKEIAGSIDGYANLTDEQQQFLKKAVAKAIEDAPAEPDASAAVLRRLGGTSRYGTLMINTEAGSLPVTKSPTDNSPVAKLTLYNPGKGKIEVKMIGTGRTYTLNPGGSYPFTVYGKVYAKTVAIPPAVPGAVLVQTVPSEPIKIIPPIAEFYTYAAGTHDVALANGSFDVIQKNGRYTIRKR